MLFRSGYPQQQGFPQPNPYMGGGHNSAYQQSMNAAPYNQAYAGHSVHGSAAPIRSNYQQQQSSLMLSSKSSGNAFKKRLSNFMGDDDDDASSDVANEGMSKEDMLKQAKDRKKVAKANFNFKKKME